MKANDEAPQFCAISRAKLIQTAKNVSLDDAQGAPPFAHQANSYSYLQVSAGVQYRRFGQNIIQHNSRYVE